MKNKSEIEKHILSEFRNRYKEFPKGKLKKWESPDFLLYISPKKIIAIELTGVYEDYSINAIKHLISKKEEKICLYQKTKPYLIWLIIYTDNDIKGLINDSENIVENSSFNKIFLYYTKNRKISVLK